MINSIMPISFTHNPVPLDPELDQALTAAYEVRPCHKKWWDDVQKQREAEVADAFTKYGNNVSVVARALGLNRQMVQKYRTKFGIQSPHHLSSPLSKTRAKPEWWPTHKKTPG